MLPCSSVTGQINDVFTIQTLQLSETCPLPRPQDTSLCVPHLERAALSRAVAVVSLNVTLASALEHKSLEALQKAVFEISGGDAALKSDMSQYVMQLHVCGDCAMWGAGAPAADAALSSAAAARPRGGTSAAAAQTHGTAACNAAAPQQMVLYALVLSLQTVRALRNDVE